MWMLILAIFIVTWIITRSFIIPFCLWWIYFCFYAIPVIGWQGCIFLIFAGNFVWIGTWYQLKYCPENCVLNEENKDLMVKSTMATIAYEVLKDKDKE